MADLVAIEYDDVYKAHEVRLALAKLQRASLIDVDDAVVAVKDANGKVLQTSLSHESEARLRASLDAGQGADERHRG